MISVTIHSPNFELGADWDDLVSRAHPNVFMSPAALRAADVTRFAKVQMLLAWDDSVQPRRLVGLWAMQQRRTWPFGTVVLEALPFDYAFLSSPVIDLDLASDVMPAFLTAIAEAPKMPRIILMKSLDAEAASYRPLVDGVAARGGRVLIVKTENRPVMWRGESSPATGERAKKLRQGWKRMSALGATAMVFITEPDAVGAAVETFLQLEFRSWKGAAGTALLCREEDANFVRRLIANLAAQGQAGVQALQIDGKTIATQVLLFSGQMAYTWKTAFDQAYAKFSPGVILIDRATEHLFAKKTIVGIDSCSAESSFMSQIWYGRRAMADILVAVGPGPSFTFWVEAARHVARERLKRLRDNIIARRDSRRSRPGTESAATAAIRTTAQKNVPGTKVPATDSIIETSSPPLAQDSHTTTTQKRSQQAGVVPYDV